MYQALYRKWRPKTFSQVVGQDHITGTLQRQVAEGRTAHAYLFTGTRGTGKTTCARILAKAVNCLHPEDGAPCNQCEACRGIDSGSLLDVTELDAASNSRVDDIRELLSESVYTPTVLKKRVYIIDEVHMLSTQAFNALLKTIEEPPEHLMFILATTELHKVPATILSRCQRFTFKRILPRDMEKHLLEIARAEQIDLTPDGAEILARMANGALRDALSLLDQCRVAQGQLDSRAVLDILGLAGSVQTVELMDCILRRDAAGALTRLDGLYRGGKDVAAMLGELGDLARDMTILKAAPDGAAALLTGIYDTKTLKSLSGSQPMRRFLYLTETLQSCCAGLGDSFQPRTDAELCLLRLCDESLSGDLTALSQRIDRLEDQAANGIPVKTVPQTAGTSPKTAPLSRDSAGTSRDVPSDDRPPMPEEPPLPEEPGGRERVYDIPDEEPPAGPEAAGGEVCRRGGRHRQVGRHEGALQGPPGGEPPGVSEHGPGSGGRRLPDAVLPERVRPGLPEQQHGAARAAGGGLRRRGADHPGGADGGRCSGREKARQAPAQAGKSDGKSAGEAPGESPGAGADAPLGGASGGKGPGQAGRGGRPGPPAGKFQNQVIARY